MNKCHAPLNFVNNTTPALNDTNLNYLDGCVDTIDDRVVALANDPPENALKAEGFALGTQGGQPVTSSSPYYHNNAKYYRDEAEQIAAQSLGGLSDVGISDPQDGQILTYDGNVGEWVNDSMSGISGKADKVDGATNGHLAGLNASGNLTDSGKSVSDFAQVSSNVLTAKTLANATTVATLADKQVRNIYAGTTDLTAGTSALTTGDIYLVYE